ncbi:glucose dehydrogenase [Reticulibacter mediterranei]|uniref:Glucose dehydrogenase n=1 Tax=Reticulibacter mediterranei TaxID=2778369 RepID=A0A8J3IGC8_9CHLR|nr:glucose 1-dehydrogenase [Reticulibacter mediterranei]GHO91955.1 glucose dehydrogenase [Reticulibacter mediterranei]
MRAIAIFPKEKSIKLIEHEAPHITSPTQVKLRMLEVGVCGTDKEICTFRFGAPPPGYNYLVLGHEALGEVVEVGTGVQRLKPGDLVIPTVRRPCSDSNCRACAVARQDFCFTGEYTEYGIKSQHGYMTEFVVDDEQFMHPVPQELRNVAVLTEPLTIAEKALLQVWAMQQRLPWQMPDAPADQPGKGLKAVVLGAGPISLLGSMALIVAGFDTYVYSRSVPPHPKAELVQSIGATYISSKTTSVEDMVKQVGNIDLVYEGLGGSTLPFEVMNHLGRNAIFAFTGVPTFTTSTQATDQLMSRLVGKNQVVFGTVNAGNDAFAAAIRDLHIFTQRWPAAVRSLISQRVSMENAQDALLGKYGGIKTVVTIAE